MLTHRKSNNSNWGSDVGFSSFSGSLTTTVSANSNTSDLSLGDDMAFQDRTAEFMSTVKNMQCRLNNGYQTKKSERRVKDTPDRIYFMREAKDIGKLISETFIKLEKLTLLAKKKSLFDDNSVEINELTHIIKQDIRGLNERIAKLREETKSSHWGKKKHMESHSNSVMVLLQSKLASMSSDFKQVLEHRTENLRHQKNHREQFSKTGVSTSFPASAVSGFNGSVLLSDDQRWSSGDVAINMDNVGDSGSQRQLLLVDEQDSYIQDRADTMQNIESTIVELGNIFQQLAFMVKEQEEMVHRIDANVEDTQLNVEAAHTQILRYFQGVTSNRWLMLKIFAVLIVFFLGFILLA